MNLIEWLYSVLKGYFFIRNILWGISGLFAFFSVIMLFMKGLMKFFWIALLTGAGIFFFHLSTLMSAEDLKSVYDKNIALFDNVEAAAPKEMLKSVSKKNDEFFSRASKNMKIVKAVAEKKGIAFSKRQIAYVAKGMATEEMKVPMLFSYTCGDEMCFGRRTAEKIFPELGIERRLEIFGISEE